MKRILAVLFAVVIMFSALSTAYASPTYRRCRGCDVEWLENWIPGFFLPVESCFSCPKTMHCEDCGVQNRIAYSKQLSNCLCKPQPPCKACKSLTCNASECPGWEKCKRGGMHWNCRQDVWTWDGDKFCTSWDCVSYPCFDCGIVDCRLRCWVRICPEEDCFRNPCWIHWSAQWVKAETTQPSETTATQTTAPITTFSLEQPYAVTDETFATRPTAPTTSAPTTTAAVTTDVEPLEPEKPIGTLKALSILKHIVKLEFLTDEQQQELICCGDEETVTTADALCVLKKVVGIECAAFNKN